ncbi:MAG: methyltransferase domain-containing protein [Bdellovibrionales bacterium]|nr:methyltransferase domain-containing protein [Bdellovibrionales bacterium]
MRRFKGWLVPGPEAPAWEQVEAGAGRTADSLSGHWKLLQLENGHRFSSDDVLTAWYATVCAGAVHRALDLGSGLGTVAQVAAWRLPGSHWVTIEAQSESIELARQSVELNGLSARFDLRQGDFREPGILKEGETFDLITGSPPYFPLETGTHADHPQKVACRFELRGDIRAYCETASPRLAPGGVFCCVFPVRPDHQERRMLEAGAAAGLTLWRRRDVVLREGEAPLLGLFAWVRSDHLPDDLAGSGPWVEPALILRAADGSVHPEYRRIKPSFGFPPTGR